MNDQSQMLNPPQMISQPQMLSQSQMLNQAQIMNQNQPPQMMNQPHQMMNQNRAHQMMNQNQPQLMNQSQMMNRSYGLWQQQPAKSSMDSMTFSNPLKPNFTASKPSMSGRSNWKGKKVIDKRKDQRRNEQQKQIPVANTGISGAARGGGGGGGGYKPPTLNELQSQNRLRTRRFYHPKKKFNNRFAPFAPRNTSSFIIRAKKSGGIASLVSPCPVTPAVLPTPIFSPSREVLGDMAKEEWGVDGYGSMNGLIRLRSPGNEGNVHDDEEEDEDEGGSSESDVEEHVEVERRLDHDLSRFEMIYPNCGVEYNNVLGNRVDDQDTHIMQLEEENLTLKERLFLMERELGDLRRRLQCLERQNQMVEDVTEEVVENGSDNESESGGKGEVRAQGGENNEVLLDYVARNERNRDVDAKENNEDVLEYACGNEGGRRVEEDNNDEALENEGVGDVCMEELAIAPEVEVIAEEDEAKDEEVDKTSSEKNIGDGDLSNCPALM